MAHMHTTHSGNKCSEEREREREMSPLAAYKKLKMARGCVAPNFSFWQQLVDAELSLASGQCVSILFYRICDVDATTECNKSATRVQQE